MNDLHAAIRCNADVDKIQLIGVRDARKVSAELRASAMRAFVNRRRNYDPRHTIIRGMRNTLQDGMKAAFFAGWERSQGFAAGDANSALKLSILSLSVYADALRVMQNRLKMRASDLTKLQKKVQTNALKVLNDVSAKTEHKLRETVAGLIEDGAHSREAIATLNESFNQLGLTPKSDFQLETIFRTQTALTYSAGRWQADNQPEIREILWGYRYVTVGDDRVRPEHEALDGVTLPVDDPFWNKFFPPNGWNCRCQAIPIFEEREQITAPEHDADGNAIEPDKGFAFNPGKVF